MINLKNSKGFSLVELMVVVAAIGVITSIGIPQYSKFKIKSMQIESKAQLSTFYVAEKSFFFEYQGYHSSLKVIGYAPAGRTRYNVGFGHQGTVPDNAPPADSTKLSTKQICSGRYGRGTDSRCQLIIETPSIPATSTVNATSFLVTATTFPEFMLLAQSLGSTTLVSLAFQAIAIGNSAQAAFGEPCYLTVESVMMNESKQMTSTNTASYFRQCPM